MVIKFTPFQDANIVAEKSNAPDCYKGFISQKYTNIVFYNIFDFIYFYHDKLLKVMLNKY